MSPYSFVFPFHLVPLMLNAQKISLSQINLDLHSFSKHESICLILRENMLKNPSFINAK